MNKVLNKRYEIIGVLGRGGMGSVYKVRDRKRQNTVFAVKELRAAGLPVHKIREAVNLFQTEARILVRLSHPNIPKVRDYFSSRSSHYIVMEYIPGRTLEDLLAARKGKPVNERVALTWALQICRALHFLSVQKPKPVVFRDLKPSNIMITGDGRVKLIDFGIARFFKPDRQEDTYIYGTPGYAAPEQYGLGQTDVRSDIYALGATLHHCLTGRGPSEADRELSDPRKINPRISKETAAVVSKALSHDREKRYQSAFAMKQAIQKIVLDLASPVKGAGKIIYARPGKLIRLPWWRKTAWVSVPVMALGCSGATGTLSSDDLWIKPKPRAFGPDAAWLLFKVEGGMLKPGREYRPRITVQTEEGELRPRLSFRRTRPWLIIEAALLAVAVALALLVR
ncbi:MAG TPA: serine/threonine-protein kinase [Nitrospirota bacterium]|nr:serine/threonine-protein kinase [Nitrospirota bacterium]